MRQILLVTALLALSAIHANAFALTSDFITGFESGIFFRNSTKMTEEYGCPDPTSNN